MTDYTYQDLRNEFNFDNDGSHEHVVSWLICICDYLHWVCAETPPEEWQYRPGLGYDSDDDYVASVIRQAGKDTALRLGRVLWRYKERIDANL